MYHTATKEMQMTNKIDKMTSTTTVENTWVMSGSDDVSLDRLPTRTIRRFLITVFFEEASDMVVCEIIIVKLPTLHSLSQEGSSLDGRPRCSYLVPRVLDFRLSKPNLEASHGGQCFWIPLL